MTVREQEIEETSKLKLKGAMLVRARGLTPDERDAEGWQDYPEDIPCTEYDNGAILYPACEECKKPGTIYGSYAGGRWGITTTGEPYERPKGRKETPKWAFPAAAMAVLLVAFVAAGVITLWKVNQHQQDQVQQQQQIIREQRAMMARQLENQRSIQRILRGNQDSLKKSLGDIKDTVAGVVAERDGLRSANAQLSQSNQDLQNRLSGRGGGKGGGSR